jgi:hypothetical protein
MENPHDIRELKKMGLNSYLKEYVFPNLEKLLKTAIEELSIEAKKTKEELDKVVKIGDNDTYFEHHIILDEILSIENRILLIYEMIIVNDYREFELVLKRLLKTYLEIEEKVFRSFENLKPLLKNKGIIFSEIKNYKEINDLRKINNHIKHSKIDKIPNELKHIHEFRNIGNLNYTALAEFHDRVKDLRYNFIFDLKKKIYSHLYEYDEDRIKNIASRMLKRMDRKHIDLFIEELNKLE